MHPKTKELFDKAGVEYHPSTAEYVKMDFERRVGKGGLNDASRSPIRQRIDQVYRIRPGGGQDYIIYNQTTIARDMPGNEHTLNEVVGVHEEPTFTMTYDADTGEARPSKIAGSKTVYDIPGTPENLRQILDKNTEQDAATSFVLADGTAKYGGFSRDEFLTKHFDDLLVKATTGQYPAKLKPFGNKEQQQDKVRTGAEDVPESDYPLLEAQQEEEKEEEDENNKNPPHKRVIKQIKKDLIAETEKGSQEEKEYEKFEKQFNDAELKTLGDNEEEEEEEKGEFEPNIIEKEEEEEKEEEDDDTKITYPADTASKTKTPFRKSARHQRSTSMSKR